MTLIDIQTIKFTLSQYLDTHPVRQADIEVTAVDADFGGAVGIGKTYFAVFKFVACLCPLFR